MDIRLEVKLTEPGAGRLFAPIGMVTPHLCAERFALQGAACALVAEAQTGQWVAVSENVAPGVTFETVFGAGSAEYPEAMFRHRKNRFTTAAVALVASAQEVAGAAGGGLAGISAIVNDTARQFSYGHVETRFYDGHDEIPALCGLTQGSCGDINAYLIAALRAAGYEAGYVAGYFFPAEKRGRCEDMHCWVVTRHNGHTQEWDIAHHLKMGRTDIAAGLNPKPGVRVPMAHSMGHSLPALGLSGLKILSQPMWLGDDGKASRAEVEISLDGWEALLESAAVA